MNAKIGEMRTIANLPVHFVLVTDSQDVEATKEYLPEFAQGYDSFFVEVLDGDYGQVWGFCGTVPYLSKLTMRVQ